MSAQIHAFAKPLSPIKQVETRFDPEFGVLWGCMNPAPRPCFSPQLLDELGDFVRSIDDSRGVYKHQGLEQRINYAVIASNVPGVFNLGGDLLLFKQAIGNRDRDQLIRYGRKCIDNQFPWYRNFELPLTTISLVQGDALGGGFECALSSTVLVAEESSRMGFPEILFNLFPGMGAYSFLVRKIGRRKTEDMITSGNLYSARDLYELGVVDVVTPDGTGEAAVYGYIRKHARAANARRAIEAVRNEFEPVTHRELVRIVEIWADAALNLSARDLKMMDRLIRAQQRGGAGDLDSTTASNILRMEAAGVGD
ncbi:MAG: crotonase/enoyl-CoA hydratase family protein [Betaproteobacteria bacterium]|nr:crotonase/enoyl-CoA hydratase family protein [Betaproteobacteria bacterium]